VWPWNVAATTYPSFRECLVQVRRLSKELGDISHMTVWTVLLIRLSFRPYKFQLLQELKPNDRPHRRNVCIDTLNCLKEYNLFLNKIVLSNEATFHLLGKVNRHNLIIWGSQNPLQVVEVHRKMDRPWRLHSMPPKSPNLTPMDFSFWGFVKDNVYIPPMPVDLRDL
jgi:hypothetical protein